MSAPVRVVRAHAVAKEKGTELIIGSEFHLEEDVISFCWPVTGAVWLFKSFDQLRSPGYARVVTVWITQW